MSSESCNHFMLWYTHRYGLQGSSLFSIVTSGLLILPIATLNSLILLAIWRKPAFHTPSNIFICNLALADMAVAVFGIPSALVYRIHELCSGDPQLVCYFAYSATIAGTTVSGTSCLTLICAICDRYLALSLHLRYPSIVTNGRVIFTCVFTWVVSFTTAMLIFIGITVYKVVVILLMTPCVFIVLFCYYKIFRIVHRHQTQINVQVNNQHQGVFQNLTRYRKTVSALVYLLIIFFSFYAPVLGISLYHFFRGQTMTFMHGWTIATALIFINSVLNPIICCWKLGELRIAVKQMVLKLISRNNSITTWLNQSTIDCRRSPDLS